MGSGGHPVRLALEFVEQCRDASARAPTGGARTDNEGVDARRPCKPDR